MKYIGMPAGMRILFKKTFRDKLITVLGYSAHEADRTAAAAGPKYREIIGRLPEFEKADRFRMNIVNCALFASFLLSMEKKPDAARAAEYYAQAMMTGPMKWFCRMGGRRKFSKKDIRGMKATAALNAPGTWNSCPTRTAAATKRASPAAGSAR